DKSLFAHGRRHHRLQFKVFVRNVQSDQSIRRKFAQVEVDGLGGEQVNGNGVARECIDDQQPESLVRLAQQRQTAIPKNHSAVRGAVLEKGEAYRVVRDLLHQRIDLEKGKFLPGLTVVGQASGAKSDDSDSGLGLGLHLREENLPDRAVGM